jgi:serine/threonine protein kinase
MKVATPGYRAPELSLHCTTYGPGVDIWSIGCIFAEMMGVNLFVYVLDETQELRNIVRVIGTPTPSQFERIRRNHVSLGLVWKKHQQRLMIIMRQPEIKIPPQLFTVIYPKDPFERIWPTAPRESKQAFFLYFRNSQLSPFISVTSSLPTRRFSQVRSGRTYLSDTSDFSSVLPERSATARCSSHAV